MNTVTECDWYDTWTPEAGLSVTALPARHFSGRGFKRNQALWASFVLSLNGRNIYIGGDSGYDTHFAEIGEKYGPFDMAILENGQYNKSWKHIHMMPEETVQAAADMKATRLVPVHWGKFSLSPHSWDDPIIRIFTAAKQKSMPLLHPMIGEATDLDAPASQKTWWKEF